MLVGKAMSCKSTALQLLSETLESINGEGTVQLHTFNPKSVSLD
jgi:hypothetical protein